MDKNVMIERERIGLREISLGSILGMLIGVCICIVANLFTTITILGIILLLALLGLKYDYRTITLLLILAAYINLVKPLTGIWFAPIIIDLVVFVIFLRIFLTKILENKPLFLSPIVEGSLIFFILISVIQLFNPNVPSLQAGLHGFRKTTFQMFGLFLGIYGIKKKEEVERLIKYLCFSSIPILLYGVKQFFYFSNFDKKIISSNLAAEPTTTFLGYNRAVSILSGPFHFGMFSILSFLFSIHLYLRHKKNIYLFIAGVSLFSVFLSMTRVNVVALVLSGGIFWLFYEKGKGQERLGRRIFILITVVLLVGIILTQFTRLSLVIQSLFKMNLDQRLLYRIEGWKRIIPTILSQPVLAYGMGSAGDTLQRLYNFKIHFTSHNLALKILLETGIIGFIFYLSFIGSWLLYIAGLKRDTKDIGIKNLALLSICLLLIILINGLTGSAVEAYPINLYIWFFMGALLRIWRNERREKRDQYSSLSNT